MNLFWDKVMPLCVEGYPWGEKMSKSRTQKAWKAGLVPKLKAMDMKEFDLFLAEVVMVAARKQIMGVDLTEKVNLFRELRGKKD